MPPPRGLPERLVLDLQHHEGFQNAGSAREPSAVALSSLVAALRGGAIYSFTRARGYQIVLGFATDGLPPPGQKRSLLPLASGDENIGACSFRSP